MMAATTYKYPGADRDDDSAPKREQSLMRSTSLPGPKSLRWNQPTHHQEREAAFLSWLDDVRVKKSADAQLNQEKASQLGSYIRKERLKYNKKMSSVGEKVRGSPLMLEASYGKKTPLSPSSEAGQSALQKDLASPPSK